MLEDEVIITGNRAVARSFAKINLTLDVLGRRENGYHNIETIMQTVSLFDLIVIDKAPYGIQLTSNLKYLPTNEKNLAYKATKAFFAHTGIKGGVRITIHKNIPVSAGLAGGSGNCAAVLCAMNKLFNARLGTDTLCEIGTALGADVPYCIHGGTQLACGIGEILTPLPHMQKTTILIVKPPINISTAAIYEQIDAISAPQHPDAAAVISALEHKNTAELAKNLCNVMELVTEKLHPVIKGIKHKMILNGALGAVMSGSGPSVFGIFDDEYKAKLSHDSFSHQYKDVFLVNTI